MIVLKNQDQEDLLEDLNLEDEREKCIKLFAQNASKNAKFLSSQLKENQFCAEIVSETKNLKIRKNSK